MKESVPTTAAIALGSAALALAIVGLVRPNLSAGTGDYIDCVERCVEIFREEGPSRVSCIEGCAKVAEPEAAPATDAAR